MSRAAGEVDALACFLIILGILILLVVLFSQVRLGIRLAWGEGIFTAYGSVGPFRFRLYPPKKAAKSAETSTAPEQKSPPKKRRSFQRPSIKEIRAATEELLPPLRRALAHTRRKIRISPLQISVIIGGATDPAAAAELYGLLHMAVWTFMPLLEQLICIREPQIHLGMDFDAPQTISRGQLSISLSLSALVWIAAGMGIPVMKFVAKNQKQQTGAVQTASAA